MQALARMSVATRLYFTQALSVELVYRYALAQSFVGYSIGFAGLCFFWLAASRNSVGATGYDAATLVAYFVLVTAHSILHETRLSFALSTAIRMGKLSASLLRPYPFIWSLLAQTAAQVAIRAVLLLPILGVAFSVVSLLQPATAAITVELAWRYSLAVLLALAASWSVKIVVGLLAFDMTQTWGPELVFLAIYSAASGAGYPADLLPPTLLTVVEWTPVYYMVGFPALVLLGRIDALEFWQSMGRGCLVTVLTTAVIFAMWRRGIRKFEAIGI